MSSGESSAKRPSSSTVDQCDKCRRVECLESRDKTEDDKEGTYRFRMPVVSTIVRILYSHCEET